MASTPRRRPDKTVRRRSHGLPGGIPFRVPTPVRPKGAAIGRPRARIHRYRSNRIVARPQRRHHHQFTRTGHHRGGSGVSVSSDGCAPHESTFVPRNGGGRHAGGWTGPGLRWGNRGSHGSSRLWLPDVRRRRSGPPPTRLPPRPEGSGRDRSGTGDRELHRGDDGEPLVRQPPRNVGAGRLLAEGTGRQAHHHDVRRAREPGQRLPHAERVSNQRCRPELESGPPLPGARQSRLRRGFDRGGGGVLPWRGPAVHLGHGPHVPDR